MYLCSTLHHSYKSASIFGHEIEDILIKFRLWFICCISYRVQGAHHLGFVGHIIYLYLRCPTDGLSLSVFTHNSLLWLSMLAYTLISIYHYLLSWSLSLRWIPPVNFWVFVICTPIIWCLMTRYFHPALPYVIQSPDKISHSLSISVSFIPKFAEVNLQGHSVQSHPNLRREESQKLVCRHAFWER